MTIDQASDACKAAHAAKLAAETALADAKAALANALGVWTDLFLGDEVGGACPGTAARERAEMAHRAAVVYSNRGTGFDRGGW